MSEINWIEILATVSTVIAVASFVANITPTKRDDKWLSIVARIIDFIALNFNVQKHKEIQVESEKGLGELFMAGMAGAASPGRIVAGKTSDEIEEMLYGSRAADKELKKNLIKPTHRPTHSRKGEKNEIDDGIRRPIDSTRPHGGTRKKN